MTILPKTNDQHNGGEQIYGESDIICGFGVGGPSPASKMLILGHLCRRQQWSYRQVGLRYKNGKNDFMVVKCDGGEEIVNGAYHQSTLCCHFSSITNRHDYRDFGATFESRTAVQVDGLIPRSQLSLCVWNGRSTVFRLSLSPSPRYENTKGNVSPRYHLHDLRLSCAIIRRKDRTTANEVETRLSNLSRSKALLLLLLPLPKAAIN